MSRTRVKICGLTRVEDALTAAEAGADALGLVFAPRSPRCLTPERGAELAAALPPFVSLVALFVDPEPALVEAVLRAVRPDLLQFHGDEAADFCAGFGVPWIKALRVRPETDLLQCAAAYAGTRGLLLDAYAADAHGGTGRRFDWGLIPAELPLPLILAGGLAPENVGEAIRRVRPWAVDVSSGVEAAKGIKDPALIGAFMKEVGNADVSRRG